MSFQEITGLNTNLIVPTFLISDVTGDSISLTNLTGQLLTVNENQNQIYVWHNPFPSTQNRTLSEYAVQIKQEMIKLHPEGPYNLAGFSFGGILASEVAQQLKAENKEVHLFVIDTPSIGLSQQYLQPGNINATDDLISIFNYAAQLARHHTKKEPIELTLSMQAKKELSAKPITDQIDVLKYSLINMRQDQDLQRLLRQYGERITQYLHSLLQHKNKSSFILDSIGVVSSHETCKKYGLDIADSWKTLCQKFTSNASLNGSHISCIREKSKQVAEEMSNYFRNSIDIEKFMAKKLRSLLQYKPSIDINQVLVELEKTKLSHSSSSDSVHSSRTSPSNSPFFSSASINSSPLSTPSSCSLSPSPFTLKSEMADIPMEVDHEETPKKRRHLNNNSSLQQPGTFFSVTGRTRSKEKIPAILQYMAPPRLSG